MRSGGQPLTQRQANLNTNPARSAGRIKLNPTRPHIIRCIDISGIRSHREIHEGAGVGNRIINTVGYNGLRHFLGINSRLVNSQEGLNARLNRCEGNCGEAMQTILEGIAEARV